MYAPFTLDEIIRERGGLQYCLAHCGFRPDCTLFGNVYLYDTSDGIFYATGRSLRKNGMREINTHDDPVPHRGALLGQHFGRWR